MFHYSRGYEIDGSDTSYNILTPERAKCLEIVDFYLRLKTVDRRGELEIDLKRQRRDYSLRSESEKFRLEGFRLEELGEMLASPEVTGCSIFYRYVPMNSLYPEVRREVVDIVARFDGTLRPGEPLHNPVFWDEHETTDSLDLYFTPEIARRIYECTEDISTEAYFLPILEGPYVALEIGCRLGGPFGSAAWNVTKLAERFPELRIDAGDAVQKLYEDTYLGSKRLCERIEVASDDPAAILEKLASDGAVFQIGWGLRDGDTTSRDRVWPLGLPRGLAEWDSNLYDYKAYDARGFPVEIDGRDYEAFYRILKGITGGKAVMTPGEYAAYVRKLAGASYFPDAEFVRLTTLWFHLQAPNGEEERCAFRCFRRDGGIAATIDVPHAMYPHVRHWQAW